MEKSEQLSRLLEKRGIPHEVLNAKQHTREAEIVTQAGRLHAVTVATNMAGRGVDILLGGNPEGLAPPRDAGAEGLDLETDEGRAELRGAAWPSTRGRVRAPRATRSASSAGSTCSAPSATSRRRIDNQLRGRSGRQGDPGESRFYLSLEDELMRLFATGAMSWVMGKALPDDVPIEAKMVTKAIERAQNTVEERNAEIRKNVLKYDEVMNEQRKVIYERRVQIIDGDDLRDEALEALAEAVEGIISTFCVADFPEEWDLEGLVAEVADVLADGVHRRRPAPGRRPPTSSTRTLMGEATGLLRAARGGVRRRDDARDRASGDAPDHRPAAGASTCSRWTTCRRASTCGPWVRRTRSSSGSVRASRCSAR